MITKRIMNTSINYNYNNIMKNNNITKNNNTNLSAFYIRKTQKYIFQIIKKENEIKKENKNIFLL